MTSAAPAIAVLMPCYKEEAAVACVVCDFKVALPHAAVYVYDTSLPTAPPDRDYDHYHDVARSPNPSNHSWKPLARDEAETCAGIAIELLQVVDVNRWHRDLAPASAVSFDGGSPPIRYRGVRGPRRDSHRASLILLAISAIR